MLFNSYKLNYNFHLYIRKPILYTQIGAPSSPETNRKDRTMDKELIARIIVSTFFGIVGAFIGMAIGKVIGIW